MKKNNIKIIIIIIICIALFCFYSVKSYNEVKQVGPRFNLQWQQATNWIKQNTPEDSIFAHWWDYGYYLQAKANRATLSDGGNAQPNINHYIGRHVLTTQNPEEALTFLKTYQTDYLLITSNEIGKYWAYSSIGSDKNNDKKSKIRIFSSDKNKIKKIKDGNIYLYEGIFVLEQDIEYNNQLLTKNNAAILDIMLPILTQNNSMIMEQPTAIVYSNQQQLQIPLECVFFNRQEINFPKKGLKGCIRIMPKIKEGNKVEQFGIALYFPEKIRNTLFAQMYLFDKQWPGFEKVYDDSEKDYNLVYYEPNKMIIGPLKIWKINPPANIKTDSYYLNTSARPRDLI